MSNEIRRRPEGVLLRTYLSAAGITPDSIGKPMVGIATVSTQMFSETPDAKDLAAEVVSGIKEAGGIAVRWDTVRSPELMTWGHAESYSFAWRDQLADFIESWAKQQSLDGLVLIGDAAESLAGMTMAAARLNLPAILVTSGPRRWEFGQAAEGDAANKKKEFSDPFELIVETLYSKKGADENESTEKKIQLEQLNECLIRKDDHSTYAMDLVLEAMGLTLPGMATAPADSSRRKDLAHASGERIISLIKLGHGTRRILTGNAFANGILLDAALGGSIDVAVHIMAIANEAGHPISIDLFEKTAQTTAQVCNMGGVGHKAAVTIEDLDKAGGVWAILHGLKSQVLPNNTVGGKGAMELAKINLIKDAHVISANRPIRKQSGVGVIKGNLAPEGAVFLLNQILPDLKQIKGTAKVFEDEISAIEAINAGDVKQGHILFVRGQGPKGGPGLRKLRILPALMESRELNKLIPVITDGRLPDEPAGLFISLVSPEGVSKGPLSVIKEDDVVEIDIEKREFCLRLTDTDLRIRLARWQSPEPKEKTGFLNRYSKYVSGVHEGAILK